MNVVPRSFEPDTARHISPVQAFDCIGQSLILWNGKFRNAVEEMMSHPFDPLNFPRMWTQMILMNCTFAEDIRRTIDQTGIYNPYSEMIHGTINWLKGLSDASIITLQDPTNTYNIQKSLQEIVLAQLGLASEISDFLKNKVGDNSLSNIIDAEVHSREIFLSHREKPSWNLDIEPVIVHKQDFCDILKFENPKLPKNAPKVFLVAPMSGHYSTLLRGTVKELMKKNHVYITDWKDARQVPKNIEFGTDDFTAHIIEAFQVLGKEGVKSIVSVCQPCPWVLAAAAYCEKNGLFAPKDIILMSGPVDISKNPTDVNKHAYRQSVTQLENKVISRVPKTTNGEVNPGGGREVYPGWLQLMSFMGMNVDRHLTQLQNLREAFLNGNYDSVKKEVIFYDEYMAVMDLTKKFFLETVQRVFINNEAASGKIRFSSPKKYGFKDQEIDLSWYTGRLLTMESELDDVCGLGQTKAALEICKYAEEKVYYMLRLAGHYGVFDGTMFQLFVAPRINLFIRGGDISSYVDTPEAVAYLEKKLAERKGKMN